MAWRRALDAGLVRVGPRVIDRSHPLHVGDVVTYEFPTTVPSELKAVKLPLDVLFEDKHMLVLNKAPGMVVHPGAGTRDDTLVHALLAHCAELLSGIGGVERPGIVHRLDRDTSGSFWWPSPTRRTAGSRRSFPGGRLKKEYLALVDGVPRLLSGSIRKPIGRNPRQRHKMAVAEEGQPGRDAHTDWEVVENFGNVAALVRCTLHTGRTHQIRVHLKSLGHILVGDVIYGWNPIRSARPAPG